MDRRLELQDILQGMLPQGSRAWYQSPGKESMTYPAIVYSLIDEKVRNADNSPYIQRDLYSVTVIDSNPDSKLWRKVAARPLSSFSRRYVVDNLYHTVINLHF